MANNAWERIIKFKADARDLKNAVNLVTKDLKKIDSFVGKINKSFDAQAKKVAFVNKQLDKASKNLQRAESAARKLASTLDKAGKSAFGLSKAILNIIKGQNGLANLIGRVGLLDGALRAVSGHGLKYFERQLKNATAPLLAFGLAHAGVIAAIGGGAIVAVKGARSFYNLGKAARQAEVNVKQLYAAYKKGGFQALFPAGSRLGGDRSKEDIKRVVDEQKKLEKSAEKTQKQYKLAATGLNKLRERLEKTKKIQDQLLSSSKGYVNVSKKVLSIEKEITKEQRKRANINRRLDWGKDLMKLVGGRAGLVKGALGAGGGAVGGFLADAGIRKLSGLLGKQVGLFKAVQVSASGFWKALQAINKGASAAVLSLDKYGRRIVALIGEHQRLIQSVAGLTAGLTAALKVAPLAYNLGKGFRQLTFDIRKATEAVKKYGLEAGILSYAGKGSFAGKRFRELMKGRPEALKHPSFEKELKDWGGQYGTSGIQSQVAGLKAVGDVLRRNKEIQDNISANYKGAYLQSVVAVKKAQFAYNLELLKTKAIQHAVNLDIWAAKKALTDTASVLKGIAGIATGGLKGLLGGFGGLVTGKAGKLGQAAAVIGVSDAVKRLAQHIPFVSQAWKDNVEVFAQWTKRVTEGLTAVTIAHGAFSKAIGAAQWTIGAIGGFIKWEKAAMLSFHRVRKGWQDLAHDISKWQVKGMLNMRRNNPVENLWDKIVGGRRAEVADIYLQKKPTKDPLMVRMERALETSQRMLKQTDTTAANYEKRQRRVLAIERRINREMEQRRALLESMTPRDLTGQSSYVGKQRVRNRMAMDRGHKFSGFGDWSRAIDQRAAQYKADADRELRLNKILAINKKLEASGKAQLSTYSYLSRKRQDELSATTALAAQREAEAVNPIMTTGAEAYRRGERRFVGKDVWARYNRMKQSRRDRRERFNESMMLGAGFPLLFGGGVGSVAGGVTGAAMMRGGKGFGAQILFSALGQQLDAFVVKTKEVGDALRRPTENLQALRDAAGVAGTDIDRTSKELERLGLKASAAELLTAQIADFADIDALKGLSDSWEKLSNVMAKLTIQTMALISGPISKFMTMMSRTLEGVVNATDARSLFNQLSGEKRGAFQQRLGELMPSAAPQNWWERNIDPQGSGTFHRAASSGIPMNIWRQLKEEFDPSSAPGKMKEAKALISQARGLETGEFGLAGQIELEREKLSLTDSQYQTKVKQLAIDRQSAEISLKMTELNKMKEGSAKDQLEHEVNKMRLSKQLAEAELDNLKRMDSMYYKIGQTIKNGMVSAIEDAITGARSLSQILADLAQSFGRTFLQKAIEIGVGAITSSWGNTSGGGGTGPNMTGPNTTQSIYTAAEGAHWKGGFKAFDQGGVVNEPTLGLVGEGGESEYIIPESKMGDALARYAGGARGDNVLAGGGEIGREGGTSSGVTGAIDVTFNTQVINDVSYVSYAEFQAGVQQAAAEGAKRGEQATLRRLQTSPSTRRRAGV